MWFGVLLPTALGGLVMKSSMTVLACLLHSQVFVVNDPVYILLYVNMSLKDSL